MVSSPMVAARGLRLVTVTLAAACGLAVANIYYAQPLLGLIAGSFRISNGIAAAVVTANQFGYALGLLLLLPLGDLVDNRKLAPRTLIGTALALAVAAASPDAALFLVMSVLVGITSVVAQILIPLAAYLAPPAERGRVVGQVMSGLLLGILLARTVASLAAAAWGWRSIYVISAVLMVATAACLARVLPSRPPDHTASYRRLLASVVVLARREPVLRRRALSQALMFATFSAFWTAITYELIGAHHLSQTGIGVFALVGAAGAGVAPLAGRLGDRGHGAVGRAAAMIIAVLAMVLAGVGADSVVLLAAAGVLLDVAVQTHLVLSQRDIYALRADARARINATFMSTVFVGGAVSSAIAGLLDDTFGWRGVTVFAAVLPVLAVLPYRRGRGVPTAPVAPDWPVTSDG
ncbi:MAG TPA: MFS transporter [Pseudonocardiaceae bacterium]|nr:MFS transporter [Pseudonocardiaceae bacterium]